MLAQVTYFSIFWHISILKQYCWYKGLYSGIPTHFPIVTFLISFSTIIFLRFSRGAPVGFLDVGGADQPSAIVMPLKHIRIGLSFRCLYVKHAYSYRCDDSEWLYQQVAMTLLHINKLDWTLAIRPCQYVTEMLGASGSNAIQLRYGCSKQHPDCPYQAYIMYIAKSS